MIESISNHGHQNIKVHLNQHGGGKGVKTEELDCFCYAVFNPPSLGVAEYEGMYRALKIISDEKGRILPTSAF